MEESIALEILNKLNEMQNQINGMQNQFNGMQNQFNGMQNQVNGIQDQFNKMQNKVDEISEIKMRLDKIENDTIFTKNTCLSILDYLEKEEKLTDEINQTTQNHEERIRILENRKYKIIPVV